MSETNDDLKANVLGLLQVEKCKVRKSRWGEDGFWKVLLDVLQGFKKITE